MEEYYDIAIIGAGPAGLTAGLYCGRAAMKTVILEKAAVGGQPMVIDSVENYPGFPDGITGFDLVEKMREQAEKFGAEFKTAEVVDIGTRENFLIKTAAGEEYRAKSIIVATGANPKKLGIKGEKELRGRGVSYCAVCDGPLFREKEVIVVGGGDAAVGEAVYLTRFAKKVTLVHRRDKLRAAAVLQERLIKNKKAQIKWNSVPTEVLGKERVTGIKIRDLSLDKEYEIGGHGVFFYVGTTPNTGFAVGAVELDKEGFIITDEAMNSSRRGIFACGDARRKTLKQIITACAEGAIAAFSCGHFIDENS